MDHARFILEVVIHLPNYFVAHRDDQNSSNDSYTNKWVFEDGRSDTGVNSIVIDNDNICEYGNITQTERDKRMRGLVIRYILKQTLVDSEMYFARKYECHVDCYSHVIRD